MPIKWTDVINTDVYKNADLPTKTKIEDTYFDTYVKTAPGFKLDFEPVIKKQLFNRNLLPEEQMQEIGLDPGPAIAESAFREPPPVIKAAPEDMTGVKTIEPSAEQKYRFFTDRLLTSVYGEDELNKIKEGQKRLNIFMTKAPKLALAFASPIYAFGFETFDQAKSVLVSTLKKEKFSLLEERYLNELLPKSAPTPIKIAAGIGESLTDIAIVGGLMNLAKGGMLKGAINEVGNKLSEAGYGEGKVTIPEEVINEAIKGTSVENAAKAYIKAKNLDIPKKIDGAVKGETGIVPVKPIIPTSEPIKTTITPAPVEGVSKGEMAGKEGIFKSELDKAMKQPYEMTQEEFKNIPVIKYIEERLKDKANPLNVTERNQLAEQLVDSGLMSIDDFNAMTRQHGFGDNVIGVKNISTGKPISSKFVEGKTGDILNYIGQWQIFHNIPLFAHRDAIVKALAEGKKVPQKIIDSYKDWSFPDINGTMGTLKEAVESYGGKLPTEGGKIAEYVNKKDWWRTAEPNEQAIKDRGLFYVSSFKEAEFYGRPQDIPSKVSIKNPLVGDEKTIMDKLGLKTPSQDISIEERFIIDKQVKDIASKQGYDSVVLMTSKGYKDFLATGKIPKSIELNVFSRPTEGGKVKEVPAPKGKISILPKKDQLLTQIDQAIKKAPDVSIQEITEKTPKITFQIDGGAEIYNTKQSLENFKERISKIGKAIQEEIAPRKVSVSRAVFKKDYGKLIKTPKGYVTDGKYMYKGELPKSVKYDETRTIDNIDILEKVLNIPTEPAKLLYYASEQVGEATGVSPNPVPQLGDDPPMAVFGMNDKYYVYNQFKFNILNDKFPDAKYGITKGGQLTLYINKKPVASLMPYLSAEGSVERTNPPLKKEAQEAGLLPKPGYKPTGGKAFAIPEGGLEEWIKRQEEAGIRLNPVEMPELVKLASDLMNKPPIVKKLMKNLGLFKYHKGIALDPKIFKNPRVAGMVLAHEIGHLIDWLPDYTISRGNILGRIAVLKRYMKSLLAEKPGMEGAVLTPKDRIRIRKLAEIELKRQIKLGERDITEEIIKEIPIYEQANISADTILSIWREAATEIRTTHPDLYEFVAKLSSAQKDSVIKQALKGIVDERILQLTGGKRVGTKTVKETVTRHLKPEEYTPGNIRKLYKKLLKQEIVKRKLFENEVIKDELKKVTQWWNPFDDSVKGGYRSYRYSAEELYAEGISVMLNQPDKLKELAPNFYKAFWNYISRKPEVEQALQELQHFLFLSEPEKLKIRQEDIRGMFKQGEEGYKEARTLYSSMQKNLWFKIRYDIIDKNIAVLEKLREAEKQGRKINPDDNPKYYLEEYSYIGGKVKNLLINIMADVIDPAEAEGISAEDIGEYLFLNRVVTERADIANPLGQNRDTAQKQLQFLRDILGEEKFIKLQSAVERFQAIVKGILSKAEKSGIIKPEAYAQIVTNPAYATFQVLDYIDDYITPAIVQQVGTLKGIANPFVATTIKTISTLRAIERNNTRKGVINFMLDNFPNEIKEAKIRRFGKYKSEPIKEEGYEVIPIRVEGKLKAYHVDPYIADTVMYTPNIATNALVSLLYHMNKGWFRPIYVNLNLGFQSYNLMRDFIRAWKLNPDVNFAGMLKKYYEAIPIAYNRIWGKKPNEIIREMQEYGMIGITYNDITSGSDVNDESMTEYLLKQYGILHHPSTNPFTKVINFIEQIGNFIETIPKVTGYLSRKTTSRPIKEIAHEVRVFSGSPDFQRKGKGYYAYNNIFLFFNAIKEGWRGDFDGAFKNPRTRGGYWWRTAKVNLLPKLIMFLAGAGVFGYEIAENYRKQSEYDKTNYTTFPIGEDEYGKAIYLRLPQDEVGRVLGGMFWKLLNLKGEDSIDLQTIADVFTPLAGQAPNISPSINIPAAWIMYLFGQTPYDIGMGRTIITEDERLVGGSYSLQPMLRWTARGVGGPFNLLAKVKSDESSVAEKVISNIPILARFIKINDYGEQAELRKTKLEAFRPRIEQKLMRRRTLRGY